MEASSIIAVKVSNIANEEIKAILKKRGLLLQGFISLFLVCIAAVTLLFESDVNNNALRNNENSFLLIFFTLIIASVSLGIGLRKQYYIRTSRIKLSENTISTIVNRKETEYLLSLFNNLALIEVREPFAKESRTFIILQSRGVLGLFFKKSILIRDIDRKESETEAQQLSNRLNLPVARIKSYIF